ncbi:MAG: hypothetical protein H6746_18380 [Deltaproteobacteria bacterium]|nr:hypothetical protein [Deltaproteobacteria bacterium]
MRRPAVAGALALCCVAAASLVGAGPAAAEPTPTSPPAPAGRWVLEPGSAHTAERLGSAAARALGRPEPEVVLGADRVELRFGDTPALSVRLLHAGPPGPDWSPHGRVVIDGALDAAAGRRLLDALAEVRPALRWREVAEAPAHVAYRADPGEAARVLAARARSLALRVDAPHAAPTSPTAGDASLAAEDRAIEELGLEDPEPSVALGAIETRLRSVRGSPKLWAAAAFEALRRGEPTRALAFADVATRMARPDADALAAWRAASGEPPASPPKGTVPARLAHPAGEALPPLPLWLALAGLLWLAAAATESPRGPALRVALAGVLLGTLAFCTRPADPPPPAEPPPLPEALLAPLAGGPCEADPALWVPEGWLIFATCAGTPTSFTLMTPSSPGGPPRVAASSDHPGPLVDAATRRLRELAATSDLELRGRPPDLPSATAATAPGDRAERLLGRALAASALPSLLLTLAMALTLLLRAAREDRRLAAALAVALLVTLASHALVPGRLVMEYTGYDLTARLASLLPLPRYGSGAVWLYGPVLDLLGVDHRHLQLANRALGALTLLPLTALTWRLTGGSRLGTAVAALLFAALPVFWRDHSSEGIQTGTTFLIVTALAALARPGRPSRAGGPVLALPLLAWAATCRPELLPTLPLFIAAVLVAAPRPGGWRLPAALAAPALALALAPHAAWLLRSTARQVAEAGIAAPSATLERLPGVLLDHNILLEGPWLPSAALLWLLAAATAPRRRALSALLLLLAAVAWFAVTAVDLPVISIPRVHLPALALLLPALAIGAARLRGWPVVNALVAAAVALGAAIGAPAVLATGNADAEEGLIRTAQAWTRAHPGACVATVSSEDPPPPRKTPRQFPRYLFDGHPVTGLDELDRIRDRCPGPAVAILGTRCYMDERPPGAPAPPGPGLLPVCARFRERHALEPLSRLTIPNRSAGTFAMYPDAPTLELGVYAVGSAESGARSTP